MHLTDEDLERIDSWARVAVFAYMPVDRPTPADWQSWEGLWDARRWNDWMDEVRALVAEVRASRALLDGKEH